MSGIQLSTSENRFLDKVQETRRSLETTIERLGSGKRVHRPSDAPPDTVALLAARSETNRAEHLAHTLGRIQVEADGLESAIARTNQVLDSAVVDAAQALGPTSTAAQRTQLASQIDDRLRQLVQAANTRIEGRYLFAGDRDQTAPFTIDFNNNPVVSAYAGTATTRQAEAAGGERVAIGIAGDEVFDAPNASVFGALNDLRQALLADDTAAIETSIESLKTARSHVSVQLTRAGQIQANIRDQIELNAGRLVTLQKVSSELEDANPIEEATKLQALQTQLETILTAHSQRPRKSLFDYLG